MKRACYHRNLRLVLEGKPTVGWLMELCEENYRHLLQMAPLLRGMQGEHLSQRKGSVDLHLQILEQTPFTTLVHLTHHFDSDPWQPDPDATLRVYHDSHQAEVIDLRQSVLPLNRGIVLPTLLQKWRINLFLSKWLVYCISQGHGFTGEPGSALPVRGETERSVA